jgi:1-acyl-sn-glycerol-3-phosphate acyltransferase
MINMVEFTMLAWLPKPLLGLFSCLFYVLNTLLWVVPIVLGSVIKAIIPLLFWQRLWSYLLDRMASNWVVLNTVNQKLFTPTIIEVEGDNKLGMQDWYLVVCNHQSWVDILVLQRVLHGKIPFLKFFLKKELIWVPFLGVAWWALDFPFMRRYNRHFLKKHPELRGKDIETTRKACHKFKYKPVSIMNFLEGTRFTEHKHQLQQSPFSNLLKPKAGGVSFVVNAMAEHLTKLVNVTIYYPQGRPTFMDFASGRVPQIKVQVETSFIESSLVGDYFNDEAYRQCFQQKINAMWHEKDRRLSQMAQE